VIPLQGPDPGARDGIRLIRGKAIDATPQVGGVACRVRHGIEPRLRGDPAAAAMAFDRAK
jgi:hypothetical protein